MSFLYRIKKGIYKFSAIVNIIGISLIILMTLMIVVDILGRLLFSKPIDGSYEIVEYAMVIIIVFAMGFCQVKHGHIEVSAVVDRFPKKLQSVANFITSFFAFAMMAMIAWQTFVKAGMDIKAGTTSGVLYIPKYPFEFIAAFGFALIALVFLIQMITPNDPNEQQDEEEMHIV